MRAVFGILTVLALLAPGAMAPNNADAQDINTPHTGSRPFQLDLHAGFTWHGVGAASGVRFGIPLMENGFIGTLNNAVYLNFGADFYWVQWRDRGRGNGWDYNWGMGFPVTLHWEFYFSESWSAFAEIGAQFYVHPEWLHGNGRFEVRQWGQWFIAAVGGSWHITPNFALTVRVGNPYVAAGLTFQFGS